MTKQTASARKAGQATGSIALIAAGPGNPDLFTVRADGLARAADVVIPDLAVAGLAGHVAPNAEIVAVTDENGLPLDRPARAKLAVEHAKAGRKVVRLFAGDPLVEGTMAVELAVITRTKVPFEVVPGVSIVDGAAAYVGVPPVFGKAEEVRFVDIESVEDWSEFADQRLTLIVRNAADRAVELAKALIAAGRKPDTPIAVTRGATTVEQRTIEATLADIGPAVKAAKQAGPGLVIVGENVAQRSKFSWFETKPLFGWRILVPRTREQSRAVVEQLRGYGAIPVEVPTISVEPPRTPQQMDRAIQGMVSGRYQWVGFTSVNAVKAIREKFDEYGLDARAMAGLKIASVVYPTADSLDEFGVRPDLVQT